MRKTVIVVLLLFASITLPLATTPAWATGGPDPSFARTYAGEPMDFSATSVEQTTDGGFIVAGLVLIPTATQTWLLRLDATGGIVWQKGYATCSLGPFGVLCSSSITVIPQAVQTHDGGFVVVSTSNVSSTTTAVWVAKVDNTGSLMWQEAFTGAGNSTGFSVSLTSDGGFVAAGRTTDALGHDSALVLRLDSAGGLVWQKSYNGLVGAAAFSVSQTSDGGFIVAGGIGPGVAWLLRLDSGARVVWQTTYFFQSEPVDSFFRSVQQTSDGGFIAAGSASAIGPAGSTSSALVVRFDSKGTPIWRKSYAGIANADARSIDQTSDGGFIVAGDTFSTGPPFIASALVLRLDSAGAITWQKAFGSSTVLAFASSVRQTSDGGFVVAGLVANPPPRGGSQALVFKLNSHGAIHPCKDLSKPGLVASTLSTTPTNIASGVDITSTPIATTFMPVDTSATSTVLCHHGFKA